MSGPDQHHAAWGETHAKVCGTEELDLFEKKEPKIKSLETRPYGAEF